MCKEKLPLFRFLRVTFKNACAMPLASLVSGFGLKRLQLSQG